MASVMSSLVCFVINIKQQHHFQEHLNFHSRTSVIIILIFKAAMSYKRLKAK